VLRFLAAALMGHLEKQVMVEKEKNFSSNWDTSLWDQVEQERQAFLKQPFG
jgi:hypothetical protein